MTASMPPRNAPREMMSYLRWLESRIGVTEGVAGAAASQANLAQRQAVSAGKFATAAATTAPFESAAPMAPGELTLAENIGYWAANNAPLARVRIEWGDVSIAEDGSAIIADAYYVLVKEGAGKWAQVATVDAPSFSMDSAPSGVDYQIKVATQSSNGGTSVESPVLTFTSATPYKVPPPPPAPELITRLGIVSAYWDGTLVDPNAGAFDAGPSLFSVQAQFTSDSLAGAWIPFDAPLKGPGSVSLPGRPLGEVVTIRFVAIGIEGDEVASPESQITVLGITGPDIEANSITANNIAAGSITVNELSPSIGGDLDLSANDSITLVAGVAGDAASLADTAKKNADKAITTANSADEKIDITQTLFQVLPDRARVSSPTQTDYAVDIKATGIDITYNNTVVSSWAANVFDVPKVTTDDIVIGQHQFTTVNTTHTVIRAV